MNIFFILVAFFDASLAIDEACADYLLIILKNTVNVKLRVFELRCGGEDEL